MSAMNDQNTETAKSTKTLIHTKNTRATSCRSIPSHKRSQKTARLATKKW